VIKKLSKLSKDEFPQNFSAFCYMLIREYLFIIDFIAGACCTCP